MKGRKRVKKSGRIARLKAMADEGTGPHDLISGMYRPVKKPVTLRLDADVLAWFKRRGRGYQTRINRALRELMWSEKKKSTE